MSELDHYEYELPRELIAQHPLATRSDARLMVVDRAQQDISTWHVRDLPELLRQGDCLVLNDTRVLPARLVGRRTSTGGRWQGMYLDSSPSGHWRVMGKTRGRLAEGETITLDDRQSVPGVQLVLVARLDDGCWLVQPRSNESLVELLERFGRVPLPPYIRDGEMQDEDLERYQTVFATQPGAVAAPTAGLHFTPELLQRLDERGVRTQRVTLHVGIGTFRPVKAERLADHRLHAEWGSIADETAEAIRDCRAAGGRCVAVGTTSVRVLETAAKSGQLQSWQGETDLFVRPPFSFQATDALLTNFHLPRSTLLVLVRTFGGDDLIRRAYQQAIDERYRFYSYGDAMLVL